MGQYWVFRIIVLAGWACMTAACASTPTPEVDAGGTATETRTGEDAGPFKPSVPEPKKYDWVLLTSGEWLKGDITVLRDDSFQFDSDELDELKLDWEDVAEVRSPRVNSILIDDEERGKGYTGKLLVTKDTVIVTTAEGEQRFPRDRLLVIVPGELTESNYWEGKVSLGISGKSGNVNQGDLSLYTFLQRRTLDSRFEAMYNGAWGTVDGEDTIDNHRFNTKYDLFLGRTWYLTPLSIEYYRDRFKNIEHQVTPAVLVGYHAANTKKVQWDIQAGAGYRYTSFDSVEAGEDSSEGTASLVAGTTFDWEITKDIDFHLNYSLQVAVPETADTNQYAFISFSIDIVGDLDLDLSLTWNRVGDPRTNSDGTTPQRDDIRYTVGLGWDF